MKRKPDIETVAAFFTHTQRLLLDAKNKRDLTALGQAKTRVDSERFKELPDDAQEGLLQLYGEAMMATGIGAP